MNRRSFLKSFAALVAVSIAFASVLNIFITEEEKIDYIDCIKFESLRLVETDVRS